MYIAYKLVAMIVIIIIITSIPIYVFYIKQIITIQLLIVA